MKVQLSQQNYPVKNNSTPGFKGTSGVLNYLATNLGVGANLTDVAFMVTPRTAKDGICRGLDAGIETGFRESMGTINDTSIGLYGMGAGALLGGMVSGRYGIKVNNVFTSPERVEALAEFWKTHLDNNTTQKEYLRSIIDEIQGYNTAKNKNGGYVKLESNKDKEKIVNILNKVIDDDSIDIKKWRKKCPERGVINALIVEATGAESRFKLRSS